MGEEPACGVVRPVSVVDVAGEHERHSLLIDDELDEVLQRPAGSQA